MAALATTYAYQDAGIEWLAPRQRALLGDDPGLGKSRQALLAAKQACPQGRILVLAPAMLLGVWADEQAKWAPELNITTTSYSTLPRLNPEFVPGYKGRNGKNPEPRFLGVPKPEFKGPWSLIIMDECHNVSNRQAIWTKAAESLRSERAWLLTGTPIPNWAHQLFILLRILHPRGDKQYTSYWRWISTWFKQFDVPRKGFKGKTATKIGGLKACSPDCPMDATCQHWADFYKGNHLDVLMLRRTRKEAKLNLPPMTEQVIKCPMVPAQAKAYKALKKDYFTLIEETGKEVMAFTDATLTTKLEQVCTGIEVADPEAKVGGSGKLDMLATLLDGRKGHPVLVVAKFRNTASAAVKVATKLGLRTTLVTGEFSVNERIGRVAVFQSGGFDVLVATLATIREGLTLTAADTCIFIERSWNPNRNTQTRDRIYRIGQANPVTSITLITPDTVDGHMSRVLKNKTAQQIKCMSAGEFATLL